LARDANFGSGVDFCRVLSALAVYLEGSKGREEGARKILYLERDYEHCGKTGADVVLRVLWVPLSVCVQYLRGDSYSVLL